ncbi:MAG: FtsH protease activity modulator HflK [Kiritimatiellia bacterium]
MPNGFGNDMEFRIPPEIRKLRPHLAWIVILGLVVIAALTSLYKVGPDEKAVVKRFGKVVAIRDSGLHGKLPFGIDQVRRVLTERVLKEEFGFRTREAGRRTRYAKTEFHKKESLMLTGDLNVIDVEWVVQYRIRDPNKFLHKVRRREEAIRDVSEAVMRRVVGNRIGSDVLTVGRVEVAALCREEMQKILDAYDMGVHVTAVKLQDVTAPDPVKPAYNEVNEARQEKERLINEAERQRNKEVPKARGEAMEIVSEAQAYATNRVNAAKGQASRFSAILEEYTQARDVTRRRLYIETMDKVISQVDRVYVVEEGQVTPIPLINIPGEK